jgi:hypothetical protein
MKGVSAIIVMVLLLMITVAVVGLTWNFLGSLVTGTDTRVGNQVENTTEKMSGCLRIEDFNPTTRNITIRNCGLTVIRSVNIFVDSSPIYVYSNVMKPNDIIDVNINVPKGSHLIYALSGSADSKKEIVEIDDMCDGVQPPQNGDWIVDSNTYCSCPASDNITVNGRIYVSSGSLLNINGCLVWINQTSDYQYGRPTVRLYGNSRVNMLNSKIDSGKLFEVQYEDTRGYLEDSVFGSKAAGILTSGSIVTIKNSNIQTMSMAGTNPYAEFLGSFVNTWSTTGGTPGRVTGNLTITQVSWTGGNVNRSFPVIVTNSSGDVIQAVVNVTRSGVTVWGQQGTVNGYAEPVINFGPANYSAADIRLYAYSGSKVTWVAINFLSSTPISLVL